jgi:hypothetical protein
MAKTFTVQTKIPTSVVEGLITTAFEGGSNYWYTNLKADDADKLDDVEYWHIELPMMEGRYVTFKDIDDDEHRLDLAAIKKGLAIMAAKYPRHMNDAIVENDDGDTADVFLQCCIYGNVVYG